MIPKSEVRIPFFDSARCLVAHLRIVSCREESKKGKATPLVEVPEQEAAQLGESRFQLCESERYEYEVENHGPFDLRLRCSLADRRKGLKANQTDAGLIETRSYCGGLLLELVDGQINSELVVVSSSIIEVRSVKLDYRSEYRGMLRRIADEMCDLIVDARSSAKLQFRSSFEKRSDVGWLQIQVELLREILDLSLIHI